MPLRMSIAAVISLGLTVGAHFVTGQAAQQPPRVAIPAPQDGAPSKASASGGDRLEPPRVASPSDLLGPRTMGDTDVSPPRVGEPGSSTPDRSLPTLPGGATIAPPEVAASGGLVSPPAVGGAAPSPPPVADLPPANPPATAAPEPPSVADSMPFGLRLDGELPGSPDEDEPDDITDFPSTPPIVPATVQFDEFPDLSVPSDTARPFVDDEPEDEPSSPPDEDIFPEQEAPAFDAETLPDDGGIPGFESQLPETESFDNVPDLGDDPMFGLQSEPPADLGPPEDDSAFGNSAPSAPETAPGSDNAPRFRDVAPVPDEPPSEPAGSSSFGGRSAAPAPDFSSAEPPADPSIRTSAAPRDGVGAMAESLADRLSEGPREIGLNLDVAQPPTSNINLPMKTVITLRNDGRDDAFDIVVRLPLPDGLEFLESSPQPDEQADDGRTLVWRWTSLAPSDTRVIDLSVKPLKAVPMDLVPRVTSVMAAKSRTTVQEPRLKIDLVGPNDDQVQGSEIDFSITVRNNGTGPARQVNLIATLTGGLKGFDHNGSLSDAPRFEQMIGDLAPGEVFGPVVLTVLADSKGMQNCTIEAISPDVVPATPVSAKPVNIVVPELALDVVGPESRPVGSVAEYTVTVTNQGTRHATDVAVALFAPESGVPDVPKDAKYRQDPDKRLHSIYWRIPRLDKGESRQYRVQIRLERIALYTVEAAAHCEGFREPKDTQRAQKTTEVMGIPDVKFIDVTRKDTVIDSGDTTEFEIRIKNIGSKEATNVFVDFYTNEWIAVEQTDPPNAKTSDENPYHHGFDPIDRLAPGADRTFIVTVKAQKPGPAIANFDVHLYWDGLPENAAVRNNGHVRIAEGQIARSGSNPQQ